MKRIFIAFLVCAVYFSANSQIITYDSVEVGANTEKLTFYSLADGQKTTASNTDWHLAVSIRPSLFPTSPLGGTTMRINEANGVKVYYVPNTDAAGFTTLDTTGYQTWPLLHDSDTSIDEGALNSNRDRQVAFDFGWGMYSGSLHNVTGDSLYLIQLPNGELVKFLVVNLDKDTAFNIRYSHLDNSNLQNIHISKKDYTGKQFVYLNLSSSYVYDKEPLATDWDLEFLKYTATDTVAGEYKPVLGVWVNKGNLVAKRSQHDVTDNYYGNLFFSNYLNAIGWNWKYEENNGGVITAHVQDSLAYFVQTKLGDYYKLVFTGYNTSTGKIYFYKELLSGAVGLAETSSVVATLFPNPAKDFIQVVLQTDAAAVIRISDLTGHLVFDDQTTGQLTLINTSNLANGMYLLQVATQGKISSQRMVISR